MKFCANLCLVLVFLSLPDLARGQELEPRRWAHLPVDLNFVGVGTIYLEGDLFLDPALLAENVKVDSWGIGVSYIRTFELFGKSARIDTLVPVLKARWDGLVDGTPRVIERDGLGDARISLSMNLYGSPPLKGKAFADFRARNTVTTTVGASLGLVVPTGQYNDDYLINLGSNRWVLRPSLGVLHQRHNWQYELTSSVFLYGDNKDFWRDGVREQEPLWFLQAHLNYTFRPGLWTGFSTGFGYGSESTVNGIPKGDDSRIAYWKFTLGIPINRQQGLNFSIAGTETNTIYDSDLLLVAAAWSMMFGS
jgi:hypothetical protein